MNEFKKIYVEYFNKINKKNWINYYEINIDITDKNKKDIVNDAERTYNTEISSDLIEILEKFFTIKKNWNYYQGFNFISCYFLLLFKEKKEEAFNYLIFFVDKFIDERLFGNVEDFQTCLIENTDKLINNLNNKYEIEINEEYKPHFKSLITYEYSLFFNWFFIYKKLDNLGILLLNIINYKFDFIRDLGTYLLKKSIDDTIDKTIINNNETIKKFIQDDEFFKQVISKISKDKKRNNLLGWFLSKKIELILLGAGIIALLIKIKKE